MTAPRTIGIGILGFGTVGQGVWKHLHEKQADLESRLGVKLDLRKASVRDLKKKRAVKIPASKLTFGQPEFWFAAAIAAFNVWTHRANIGRLLAGTENRFVKQS